MLILRSQVVLPSGNIVDATQKSNSDLWLALRGGSNNFGIVTAFESTAFEQGKFW
jgi:FAD/FMN-containing dehydrogenase